jgi:hypothetical protein
MDMGQDHVGSAGRCAPGSGAVGPSRHRRRIDYRDCIIAKDKADIGDGIVIYGEASSCTAMDEHSGGDLGQRQRCGFAQLGADAKRTRIADTGDAQTACGAGRREIGATLVLPIKRVLSPGGFSARPRSA